MENSAFSGTCHRSEFDLLCRGSRERRGKSMCLFSFVRPGTGLKTAVCRASAGRQQTESWRDCRRKRASNYIRFCAFPLRGRSPDRSLDAEFSDQFRFPVHANEDEYLDSFSLSVNATNCKGEHARFNKVYRNMLFRNIRLKQV